jgi:AcrR family transcriptional regulator
VNVTQVGEERKGRPAPKGRREPVTRDRVVEAALRIMDAEGLDAVTMRRVGRELGVEAMSLYNHVRDKEEILDAVTERIMADFQVPSPGDDWREDVKATAREWRRLLRLHPNVMTLLAERRKPLANPDALVPMDAALRVLREAGLDVRDAATTFHVFGGYIMGFTIMEQGIMLGHEGFEDRAREHEEFARSIADGDLPYLVEAFPVMHDCDTDEQFEFGLELLVRGLESRRAQPD